MSRPKALVEVVDGGLVAVVAVDKEQVDGGHIGQNFWQSVFETVVYSGYIADTQFAESAIGHLRKRWATFDGYKSLATARMCQIECSQPKIGAQFKDVVALHCGGKVAEQAPVAG